MLPAGKSIAIAPLVAGSLLVAALFAPTLTARFDFVDDGNLVYPAPPMSATERLARVIANIRGNYDHLGAFRPVLWGHWEVQADLLGANARSWRATRLAWLALSAGTFLWLLLELGIRPPAAIVTVALALWNPYRAEIWRSLTLAEGVAMPYAMSGLACAIRGARTPSGRWDVAAALSTLAALGCKNTFIALIPAQLVLHLLPRTGGPDGGTAPARRRAVLILLLPMLLPVVHFAVFVTGWHPGQYVLSWPSPEQLRRLLYALQQAAGLDYIGGAVLLSLPAVGRNHLRAHRDAIWAGAALLIAGSAVYLPIGGVEPRYSMPAVWGVDLWIAVWLCVLLRATAVRWQRASLAALALGALAMAIVNLGRQSRAAARSALLWQVLEHTERRVPAGATIAWVEGARLGVGEGIHFFWHLQGRNRRAVRGLLLDPVGQPLLRPEIRTSPDRPTVAITGTPDPPPLGPWEPALVFSETYWLGRRTGRCYFWTLDDDTGAKRPPDASG